MLHSVGFEGSKMLKEWLFEGEFYVDAYLFNVFCKKVAEKFGGVKYL